MNDLKWASKIGKKRWYDCIFDGFDKVERRLYKHWDKIIFFALGFLACMIYVLLQRG